MALMQRTRVLWTDYPGGPGYSNFFARVSDPDQHDPLLHMQDVADFFTTIRPSIPSLVTLSLDSEWALIDDETGVIQDLRYVDVPPAVGGSGTAGSWAAPAGAAVQWLTGAVKDGRRVMGRTFVVPAAASQFQNDGTLSQTFLTRLRDAATGYAQDRESSAVVWSRPVGGAGGSSHAISGSRVADRVAVLRSRRD